MQVTNQKPVVLSPVYKSNIQGDFEPQVYLKTTIVEPLFTPVIQSQPVKITANGTALTADDLTQYVLQCCDDSVNVTAEQFVKTLFNKTLLYFANSNLNVQDLFAIQSAIKENQAAHSTVLPFPSDTVIYTPSADVIPACRHFLTGNYSYDMFFASLAFYARPETLGFYFVNALAFDEFKTWLNTQVNTISSALPQTTVKLFNDFQKLDLQNLTESLLLRADETENNEEYSFARMLISYLMNYSSQISSAEFGVLPFNLTELFCPKSVVFVNVEQHARATSKDVTNEWTIINKSLQLPVKMVSNNKLKKLTATAKTMQKLKQQAATASSNKTMALNRVKTVRFRKTAPTTVDFAKILKRIIARMSTVAKSENTFKTVKNSFAKPNRRNPDDFNKQGKLQNTKYKPDIHLYVDTSGSISERQYQDAIKACIRMARKLNVNLYFNSFSHCLSQSTKLHIKNKSLKQIYDQFKQVPKVTGGTDYEQIWTYINNSPVRRKELSIIITDFDWSPRNAYVRHPKNLYYIPCSHMDWTMICDSARDFCQKMTKNDANIRSKLLF